MRVRTENTYSQSTKLEQNVVISAARFYILGKAMFVGRIRLTQG